MDDEPELKIVISPEPTADERDAVVAALAVLLLTEEDPTPRVHPAPTSRWARVGRIEAMRGITGRPERGWGRKR